MTDITEDTSVAIHKVSDQRQRIPDFHWKAAVREVEAKLMYRVGQKGPGTLVSSHEILGIITEEYHEYIEEVTKNAPEEAKVQELLDIAVAALFGVASIRAGGVQW